MEYSRKIRVAYLTHEINAGGAAKSLILLLKAIKKYNIEIYIYSTKNLSDDGESEILDLCKEFNKINIIEIHAFEFYLKNLSYLKYHIYSLKTKPDIIKFVKELDSKQIDILHLNSTVFSLVPKIVKKYCKVKIITHLREVIQLDDDLKKVIKLNWKLNNIKNIPKSIGYRYVQKNVIKNIFNYSDYLISISDNEIHPFKDKKKIQILPNPYDFEEDKLKAINGNQNKNQKNINICMLGAFQLLKNHMLFLKAISLLNKQNKLRESYKFYIFGGQIKSPYATKKLKKILKRIRNYIQQRINYNKMIYDYVYHNSLNDVITFIPRTQNIKDYMDNMDIVIRPDGFPWGRDIIEAMALKKAIIACGYSNFYVENEKTGILIPPASPEILADKIIELAKKEEKRKFLGKNAFRKVKIMCNLEDYGKKIFNIYKSIL